MKCALCKNEKPLRNSHIIPEFMYSATYDTDLHRFHILSSKPPLDRWGQKGIREYLLCKECEQRFCKHETYVSEIWTGRKRGNITRVNDRFMRIDGVNYNHFKLLGLSVLWRAAVSSDLLFARVDLGPHHQENLRQMLITENPGLPDKYGLTVARLVHRHIDTKTLILSPVKFGVQGHVCYSFFIGGFRWLFVVSGHGSPQVLRIQFMNEKGELPIFLGNIEDDPILMNVLSKIAEG